jgi:DNA-binding Xre family transcriptional regulator
MSRNNETQCVAFENLPAEEKNKHYIEISNIKDILIAEKTSWKALGVAIGIKSNTTLNKIRKQGLYGLNPNTIHNLCRLLDVTVEDLRNPNYIKSCKSSIRDNISTYAVSFKKATSGYGNFNPDAIFWKEVNEATARLKQRREAASEKKKMEDDLRILKIQIEDLYKKIEENKNSYINPTMKSPINAKKKDVNFNL